MRVGGNENVEGRREKMQGKKILRSKKVIHPCAMFFFLCDFILVGMKSG